ncbi:MAG: cytochrome P450 [Candidatus Binatia bacterium]
MSSASFVGASSRTVPALPPGPRLPASLQLFRWLTRPTSFMEECARRYGDCFTVRFPFGRENIIFFSNPEAIKEIFTGDPEQLRAGEANVIVRPLLGDYSLLLLDGERHLKERRLMMPPFHGERMYVYGETMRELTDQTIDTWPVGQRFSLHPSMQQITLNVILRTVFGLAENATLARLRILLTELLAQGANPFMLIPWLQLDLGPHSPWGKQVRRRREIDQLLFAEFARRRASNLTGQEDILSMLLQARDEDGQPLSDQHLRDEMVTLLVAGHETTATSLAWIFYRILSRPDVLEKLQTELRLEFGIGPITAKQINKLEYLDAVIKETQRLNPILPIVGRHLRTPMRIGGHDLPAGVVVSPCIYLTHRQAALWQNPEEFTPERFLGKKPSPYEFFPFGGGVRHCLGAAFATYEMKIVLAQVLTRMTLRLAPKKPIRVVRRSITLAPSEGTPVILEQQKA